MAVKKVEKIPARNATHKVAVGEKVKKAVAPKKPKVAKAQVEEVVKTAPLKNVKEVVKKNSSTVGKEIYFYAVGRRKTSVAQVRLYENDKATDNDLIINAKKLKDFFPTVSLQNNILAPLKAVNLYGKVRMTVLVRGGGFTGQAEAIRLGISRCIVKIDDKLKKQLKDLGFITRDSREVERKKPGLKGARRAPQWAKR